MFCTACGTRNTSDAHFCKQCGHKIDRMAPPKISEEEFALPATPEERVSELIVLAFQKHEAGDLEGAIAACSEALELRPDSTSAHSLMGMLYEKQGEREKALAEYEKVLELNPGSIADREKRDQLRDGTIRMTPRKITSSRRRAAPTLFDSPAMAAAAAVAVFLFVLMVGAWAVWMNSGRAKPVDAAMSKNVPAVPAAPSATSPSNTTPQSTATNANPQADPNAQQNLAAAPPWYPYTYPPYSAPGAQPNKQPESARSRSENYLRAVPPANVAPPSTVPMERESGSNREGQNENENTIHLPDNPNPTPNVASPQPSNPGKIVIDVVPGDGNNKSSGSGDGSGGTAQDSRARRALGQQFQIQGNYQRAIREYLKALDGAGDDTASIHQQIALCYQRLDDKESAVTHYNDAISAYKELINAGRNVESAQRGIKACEASIKALR